MNLVYACCWWVISAALFVGLLALFSVGATLFAVGFAYAWAGCAAVVLERRGRTR